MPGHKPVDMTEAQLAALTMLTEQRGLNLLSLVHKWFEEPAQRLGKRLSQGEDRIAGAVA